jgi:hypothetical protein
MEGSEQMTIEKFAEQYRLRIARDECGDKIIPGKRGHLYFADAELCLMVIDGAPAKRTRWEELGGKLWIGDLSPNAKGRRVQDVKVAGIPIENARAAIKMVRVHPKRVLSPDALEASRERMLKARESLSGRRSPAPKTLDEAPPVGR